MIKLTMRAAGILILVALIAFPVFEIIRITYLIGIVISGRIVAESIGVGVLVAAAGFLGVMLILWSLPTKKEEKDHEEKSPNNN